MANLNTLAETIFNKEYDNLNNKEKGIVHGMDNMMNHIESKVEALQKERDSLMEENKTLKLKIKDLNWKASLYLAKTA